MGCYKEWGKYPQAIECENQDLAIRQQLDDQVNIALAYYRLGWINQGWGKYEPAINYYQQSLNLHQDLDQNESVADCHYHRGLTYLDELGKIVDRAEQSLDLARAYLEVKVLEDLDQSEEIAQECLQILQEYNQGACHLCKGVFILIAQNAILTGFQPPHCQGTHWASPK